jgi:hypothetical protein
VGASERRWSQGRRGKSDSTQLPASVNGGHAVTLPLVAAGPRARGVNGNGANASVTARGESRT